MEPGFHLRYARGLAWRYRLLLALGLALLGLLHPGFALASPLALLLPQRLFVGRALREISRVSLAYATALAYGEERLWAEARRVRLEPPPFPWGLLLAYLLALVLALALPAWRPGEGGSWSLPGAERPLSPQEEPSPRDGNAPPQGQKDQGGDAPQTAEGRPDQERRPGAGDQQGSLEGADPTSRETGRKGLKPQGEGPGEGQGRGFEDTPPAGSGAKGEGPKSQGEKAQETSPPEAQEQRAQPGLGGSFPELGEPRKTPPLVPEGQGQGLLAPSGEGGEGNLPSPWPGGRPPERVRRGAEVYLERTPLPPEARELLRRYFGAP